MMSINYLTHAELHTLAAMEVTSHSKLIIHKFMYSHTCLTIMRIWLYTYRYMQFNVLLKLFRFHNQLNQ